jgi:hypothetical protein
MGSSTYREDVVVKDVARAGWDVDSTLSGSAAFVDFSRSKIEGTPRKWSFVTVRLVAEASCREDNWKSGKGKSDELHFVLVVYLVLQKIEMWEKITTKPRKN